MSPLLLTFFLYHISELVNEHWSLVLFAIIVFSVQFTKHIEGVPLKI